MKFKKSVINAMAIIFLVSISVATSFAMPGMDMANESSKATIMLEGDIKDGVKAIAHLKDIKEAMARHGGSQTHHFMIKFEADGKNQIFDSGLAAVKIIDPEGNKLSPLKMMAMDGSFGVDIELSKSGKYQFEVGTKLSDGKKRTFLFHYNNPNV